MSLSALFIDVTTLPEDGYGMFQLVFLGVAYAYILCYASNMISDGSELLLLIPSVAGLVGSVVLPVLGAVPDGAIVLFSGIGPDAQEQLTIGIGALAGSTIMLLTAPWFLSVLGGRVKIENGVANYKSPKLDPPGYFSWTETGINISDGVNKGGYLMMITSISFVIIQVPAIFDAGEGDLEVGINEKPYALIAMLSSIGMFFGYLYYEYLKSNEELAADKRLEQIVEKIKIGEITLRGVVLAELRANDIVVDEKRTLTGPEASKVQQSLESIVKPFFRKYDTHSNGYLDKTELKLVFKDLGEAPSVSNLEQIFEDFDTNKDGKISYDEFVNGITTYIATHKPKKETPETDTKDMEALANFDDEEEEEEDIPEEFENLSHDEQQAAVIFKSSWMLTLGTVLVVLFSDPMVDVLNELGARTHIPQFYVAFVLAPLASNASEVIASFNYAQKKTQKSMAISLSALQGACCMNNTFVLGIFMICVYTQTLAWQFFAETLSILVSVFFIAYMSLQPVHTMFDALMIMMVYPASLVLVYLLEAYGFD